MGSRIASLLGIAVLAMPLAVSAAEQHAPPTLTPLVANAVAAACPGTDRYAQALVRGIGERDATAAAPAFDACAASARHDYSDFRRHLASTAVGAAYLSLALLRHDPALLRRSIDATAELRSYVRASDDDIRRWPIIPDSLAPHGDTLIVRTDCAPPYPETDAAYINVAAHAGSAWISTPRESGQCPPYRPDRYLASRPFEGFAGFPASPPGPTTLPAAEPWTSGPLNH
ncbi:MAG TPA: hypothetical protein VHS78_16340 [Candidatus Elarobacter sp.]|jgi:hypothetical protein|nr:hypothetical protein [Candidatus Elarobacter sp.]